jgi:hypothetical protein
VPLPNWIFATRLIWRRRDRRRSSTDGELLGFNAVMRTTFYVAVARQASATAPVTLERNW